jgi:hypothetical protein
MHVFGQFSQRRWRRHFQPRRHAERDPQDVFGQCSPRQQWRRYSQSIPANQTSATFTVKTSKVSKTKTAKIRATANGASKEVLLTVRN